MSHFFSCFSGGRPRTVRALLVGAAALLASSVVAREYWLAPRQFEVRVGTRQYVARHTGEGFDSRPWQVSSRSVRRLLHLAPGRATDLTAAVATGDTVRTTLAFTRAGTNLVALRTTEALASFDGSAFNASLRTEGLESVLAQRTTNDQLAQPGREAFSQCVKTLVQVGDTRAAPAADDTCWRQVVGLPLELVPERNPYRLRAGDSLTLRLLVQGRPAAGQLVQVWHRKAAEAAAAPLRLRSDLRGRVHFLLPAATEILVGCVRMTPHPQRDSADWRTTRTSLTFGGPRH